jgi:hypothetical protein
MFCPECGKPLPNALVRICPNCKTTFLVPDQPDAAQVSVEPKNPSLHRARSKRSTAALFLGVGTFTFGMLTLLLKLLRADLRILYATAAATFILAPLACCFGLYGIVARAKDREKRGLPSAIVGLLLGLIFGLLAAYCLLFRIFRG